MQAFNKFLHFLVALGFFITTCLAQDAPASFCGNIQIQKPFSSTANLTNSSVLNRMILCKSQKLYFRTSIGLFPVSSIDYSSKTLTLSHSHSSSSQHYVSPVLLSAGFPSPPQPNSLLLFNCSDRRHSISPYLRNCTHIHLCGAASQVQEQKVKVPYSCILVQDIGKLDAGFHPKDLSCSGYRRVYRRALSDDDYEGVELGTRISFDIPDHAPDICNECQKPNGNCGIGLRCICHAKECKDKVVSAGGSLNDGGIILSFLLSVIFVVNFWMY